MPDFFWTPHSGFHWNRSARRFFEGWYVRLTLPDVAESFSFMYSIDDPDGGTPISGGAAQILGPGEQYFCCRLPDVEQFWAWPHRWGAGHWHRTTQPRRSVGYLSPEQFWQTVQSGYQLTATQHQGCLQDAETGAIARWDYTIEPVYGWGSTQGPQLATAGWLSYLPIFEPGWQVLMAHGWATGWVEWQKRRYEFQHAPLYAEKNWGGAFPQRWFWLQANAFEGQPNLSLTAVGGLRQVLGRQETVGMVGIHVDGQLILLNSLQASFAWQVAPWGSWQVTAQNHRYRIGLRGTAETPPAEVQVPTQAGLQFACWDTTHGDLTVELWARSPHSLAPDQLILKAQTTLAALEVGGQGWTQAWNFARQVI